MAFVLTLIYLGLTIVSPSQFGSVWADYHPMVYLACLTAVVSLPAMMDHFQCSCAIQTKLILAFFLAVALSQLASGRFRGALESWQAILPSVAIFFFIVANVTSIRRLKAVVGVTIATCIGVAIEASIGYHSGIQGNPFILLQGQLPRLRAAGFLNDPNDLAQILLIALALAFAGWNPGRIIVNSFVVLAPAGFLLWAIFLTHSRGAVVGLGLLLLVGAQGKIGKAASAVLAGIFVLGMIAIDFTGGRGLSATDGVDRLSAWATGLQFFKSAPLFGIGFGRFTDFYDITAHNSLVLCLAELGLVGTTIWVALLVTAMRGLNRAMSSAIELPRQAELTEEFAGAEGVREYQLDLAESFVNVTESEAQSQCSGSGDISGPIVTQEFDGESETILSEWPRFSPESSATMIVGDFEMREQENRRPRFAGPMRLALVSFLATSCFLSRSYSITLFLMIGLATATIQLESPVPESDDWPRWLFMTLAVVLVAILVIYYAVRFRF